MPPVPVALRGVDEENRGKRARPFDAFAHQGGADPRPRSGSGTNSTSTKSDGGSPAERTKRWNPSTPTGAPFSSATSVAGQSLGSSRRARVWSSVRPE